MKAKGIKNIGLKKIPKRKNVACDVSRKIILENQALSFKLSVLLHSTKTIPQIDSEHAKCVADDQRMCHLDFRCSLDALAKIKWNSFLGILTNE